MSAPRAMKPLKPLIGAGSRLLLVHQLVLLSRSTATTTKLVITRPRAPIPSSSSSTICLSCSFTLNHRQVRLSSTKPPDNNDDNKEGPPSPPYEIPKFEDIITPPPPPPKEDPKSNPANDTNNTNTTSTTPFTSTTTEKESPQLPPPPPPPHHEDLPSAQNSRRSALNQSLSQFMDRAQTTLFAASQRINDLTGYSGIETLKQEISHLEASLAAAQTNLHNSRAAYKAAVSSRSATQREVTTLLARQKTWTPVDFERFTQLYRQDYELDASVSGAAQRLEDAERDAEEVARDLGAKILARYHEEQIWSDKIRRMSTWGTWGLMGVNVLLFLVFQFGAEPWRRSRLVRGFEAKVREALEAERALTAAAVERGREEAWIRIQEAREEKESEAVAVLAAENANAKAKARARAETGDEEATTTIPPDRVPEVVIISEPAMDVWRSLFERTTSWREFLADTDRWKTAFAELCSERQVSLRMRDLSIVALEGVAAGAFFTGSVAIFFLWRT